MLYVFVGASGVVFVAGTSSAKKTRAGVYNAPDVATGAWSKVSLVPAVQLARPDHIVVPSLDLSSSPSTTNSYCRLCASSCECERESNFHVTFTATRVSSVRQASSPRYSPKVSRGRHALFDNATPNPRISLCFTSSLCAVSFPCAPSSSLLAVLHRRRRRFPCAAL